MKWGRGIDAVDRLISEGRLQRISGAAADGTQWLGSSASLLESARREVGGNPEAAFLLAYDSARKACTGLIAQQGLRTKSGGHHVSVEEVVRAQFGGPFDAFGALRRRRAEIEYPIHPGDDIEADEAREAIDDAAAILDAAKQIITRLSLYR